MLSLAHMEINVLVDKEFKSQVKSAWLKNIIRQIQNAENVNVNSEMGLVITGDEKIQELNLKYLEEDQTNRCPVLPDERTCLHRTGFYQCPRRQNTSWRHYDFLSDSGQTGGRTPSSGKPGDYHLTDSRDSPFTGL